MIPTLVERLLESESEEAVEQLLEDESTVFWVDWKEEDDAIVGYCEEILQTGDLSAEVVNIDANPGFELYISHRGQRVKAPLVAGCEDRHITIHALNQLLKPLYDIRVCVDSNGSDSLAFLPLQMADWSALEARFGEKVGRHFRIIEEHPNLFTEAWGASHGIGGQFMGRFIRFICGWFRGGRRL